MPAIRPILPVFALILAAACATPRPGPDTPVVDINRLENALSSGEGTVLKIPAGTRLPVDVSIESPLAKVEGGKPALHLVFDRTVYWYPKYPRIISFDGKEWRKFTHVYKGSVNFGVHKKQGTPGPRASLSVAVTPR